jgi:hypothetical protein
VVLLRWSGLVLVALGATGCSLIYDADDLTATRPVDAGPDARVDAMVGDANIEALRLTGVSPPMVDEGSGTGGSRPVVVVIEGSDIEASLATVTVAFEDEQAEAATVVAQAIDPEMRYIVVALTVPVLPALAHGQTANLTLTVTQAGTDESIQLPIVGLDELEATEATTIATAGLRPRYARVNITAPVHFTGSAPALVRSVSSVDLAAVVDADAGGATPGPGGCPGATSAPAASAGCGNGAGGGGTGALGAGGGGGGFGETGTAGTPAGGLGSGGSAGATTGRPLLPILAYSSNDAGNRGNGGGTGGGALGGSAGSGGGGGGTIELSAGGALRVTEGGALRAAGGNGAGGGGGGSGGAILVRGAGGLTAPDAVWVTTPRGSGNGSGGRGGFGRARIDAPDGNVAAMVGDSAAARGPAWATDLPVISRVASPRLGVVGTPDARHGLQLNTTNRPEVQLDSSGDGVVQERLLPGLNTICLVADPGESVIRDENKNCVTIAYVPE